MAAKWIIGIDEVGRGPLAGPVCVCAVAMPVAAYQKMQWKISAHDRSIALADSKQMTAPAREVWERHAVALQSGAKIRKKNSSTLCIGVSMRSAAMIDRCGISACIASCIVSSLRQLRLDPAECMVLLDGGLKAPQQYAKQQTVIRGDSKHPIISLASVVAKVRRDKHMQRLHRAHPRYAWDVNKGYGTLSHRTAIKRHGSTPIHRKSFISKVF